MSEAVLRAHGLSKMFGGIAAVRDVSLTLHSGQIHAVIGPNGAGKTTLINLLSGDLRPSAGTIQFGGTEIAGRPIEQMARLGIARCYQRTNLFPHLSVLENCRLAAQAHHLPGLRFFRPARSYGALNDAAAEALAVTGLRDRHAMPAASLSHGEQRQLEVAMAVATRPKLLLLDEPLAGMGQDDAATITELIGRLGRNCAILLVEHDIDAVFRLAATVTVMVDGQCVASGAPDVIRGNRDVQAAYLAGGP